MKRALAFLSVTLTLLTAQAMKVEVHGNAVYASGPVVDDALSFEEALAKPGIDTVVFVNSPGGDLWTGMRVARMIADKGLKTVIAGSCVSACSIMFMGGKERSYSDAFRPALTYIGIHGAHDKTTKAVLPQQQAQIFALFKQSMGERFNADVMNKALYDMEDSGALLRVFDAQRIPKRIPYHCKSVQSLRKDCTEFKDDDAVSLGIVTTRVLTVLDLPKEYKVVPTILGRELTQVFADPSDYFQSLSAQQCSDDRCRKLVADFVANKEHKAIAVPLGRQGLGAASNRDTAAYAYVGAIYVCNHIKDQPARLCETQSVNGYDVRDFYATGDASHTEALAKLVAPADKYYANEEYGGAMTRADGLRTKKFNDITPQKLDGIKTYGTQELALALKGPQAPVLIDVLSGSNEAIPGALTLRNGGIALENSVADAAFEARFAGLLKVLSPDSSRPIVFYCASRDLWLSVNAALRAQKLGYTQVGWYRGGMESWKAANLPLASVVIRAVVQ